VFQVRYLALDEVIIINNAVIFVLINHY